MFRKLLLALTVVVALTSAVQTASAHRWRWYGGYYYSAPVYYGPTYYAPAYRAYRPVVPYGGYYGAPYVPYYPRYAVPYHGYFYYPGFGYGYYYY